MSGQRISDDHIRTLIAHAHADTLDLDEAIDVCNDLRDARAEIARLKESAAVTERRACDMASSLGEDIVRLTAELQAQSDCACAAKQHLDALLAERAGVSEAMVTQEMVDAGAHAIQEYAPDDIDNDDACEMACLVLTAALATPIPTPVDLEAIRAEAFEEAAKIVRPLDLFIAGREIGGQGYVLVDAVMDLLDDRASAIRSAAKTEAS